MKTSTINHKTIKTGMIAFVVLAVITGIAFSTVKPVASQEEAPTVWSVRCNEDPDAVKDKKGKCEIFQQIVMKETGQRVLEFAVGFPPDKSDARGVFILPLGILLTDGVQMQIDDGQTFKFDVRYCTQAGCIAFLNMNKQVVDMFSKGEKAKLLFKATDGGDVQLEMPLTGFGNTLKKIS